MRKLQRCVARDALMFAEALVVALGGGIVVLRRFKDRKLE